MKCNDLKIYTKDNKGKIEELFLDIHYLGMLSYKMSYHIINNVRNELFSNQMTLNKSIQLKHPSRDDSTDFILFKAQQRIFCLKECTLYVLVGC